MPDSDDLFPGLRTIKGGIAVTYRDSERERRPDRHFTKHPELNTILHKVVESGTASIELLGITSSRSYRYTDKLYEDHPEARACARKATQPWSTPTRSSSSRSSITTSKPDDGSEYVQVLGVIKNKRVSRWIRSDYITGPESFDKYKVVGPGGERVGVDNRLLRRRAEQP